MKETDTDTSAGAGVLLSTSVHYFCDIRLSLGVSAGGSSDYSIYTRQESQTPVQCAGTIELTDTIKRTINKSGVA